MNKGKGLGMLSVIAMSCALASCATSGQTAGPPLPSGVVDLKSLQRGTSGLPSLISSKSTGNGRFWGASPGTPLLFTFITKGSYAGIVINSLASGHPVVGHIDLSQYDTINDMAVDNKGTLYVAAGGGHAICSRLRFPGILVFPPGAKRASKFIPGPNCVPSYGVAVDKNGYVALMSTPLEIFPPNSNTPCAKVTYPFTDLLIGPSFDANDDLFMTTNYNFKHDELKVAGKECKAAGILPLGLKGLEFPGAVRIDNQGNIAVLDTGYQQRVVVYKPGQQTASRIVSFLSSGATQDFAFDQSGHLWSTSDNPVHDIQEYEYPKGGNEDGKIVPRSEGYVLWNAVFPPTY